jgi:thiamine-monophosphate kinase
MTASEAQVAGQHVAMGRGGEFDAIRAMLARWGALAEGIGDDAAVLVPPSDGQLVVSTDASVEGVHFRAGWLTAEEIGARATAAALSDVAAMGGEARWVLVALEVPEAWRDELPALADGIGRLVADANARIIGGNITRGERLALTLTVIGSTAHPVMRSGARVGDSLWVTGRLGGPRRAIAAFEAGEAPHPTIGRASRRRCHACARGRGWPRSGPAPCSTSPTGCPPTPGIWRRPAGCGANCGPT